MSSPLRGGKKRQKASKEAFFVRVPTPDEGAAFFNASAYIGKTMPYKKPQATCAMRVEDDTVAFSLLHLTKKAAMNIAGNDIQMPRGPLAKLIRHAAAISDLAADEIIAVHDDREYRLTVSRDDAGIVSLDMKPGFGDGDDRDDDVTFDLPFGAVQVTLYLHSAAVGRRIAVGFIGHIGKPGTPETITRAVSMILNSISGLVEFRLLAGIETVRVPSAPTKWASRPAARRDEDKVVLAVPVYLFGADLAPAGSGDVVVEVDLDNANSTTGRLLYHLHPEDKVAEAFEAYRAICDTAITEQLRLMLGDELAGITYDVVLGEVSSGTVERLREAMAVFATGIDLAPNQWKLHQ